MTGNARPRCLTAALLVALLAVTSCSSGTKAVNDDVRVSKSSPSASPRRTSATSPSPSSTPPIGVLVRMPAQQGTTCVSPGYPGDVLLERSTIEPVEDVVLRGVEVERPMGVELADAWIAQTPHAVRDLIGMSNWPAGDRGPAWKLRQPAVGSRLEAGRRYTLLLHIHPDPGAGSWELAQVRLRYAAGGSHHVAELGPAMSYGKPCTLQ